MIELQPRSIESMRRFSNLPEDFYARNDSLVWLGCRLYHEFKNWQICSDLVAEGIALEMLGFTARKQLTRDKQPPAWLARVIEKLNEEFTENFSTEELAMEANVHPVHLAAVFRQFQGETMGEYVQKLRVNYASKLLLKREMPLAEIAYESGFSDQSHFTRIFKRFVGLTPGAFRNSLD
jgi:AraC family transcriptional regulator